MNLTNKTIIVTGSGRGIGKYIAKRLAAEGANIVIADIIKERVESTVSEIKDLGRKALGLVVDAAKTNELDNLAKKSIEAFEHIDILVYSAGIGDKNDPILEQNLDFVKKNTNKIWCGHAQYALASALLGEKINRKNIKDFIFKAEKIAEEKGEIGVTHRTYYIALGRGLK